MVPLLNDSVLYAKIEGNKPVGLSVVQVDDSINAGDESFEKIMQLTLVKFDSKPHVYDTFDFSGTPVQKN